MAKMIQLPYNSDIIVPTATAQAVQKNNEKPISLQALGLLVNLLSYPTTWELHKTELYKRFGKNKEESVKSAWNDLMSANYIIEFKYRVGKKWEYVYYFRKVPFSPEEKAQILDKAKDCGSTPTPSGCCLREHVPRHRRRRRAGDHHPARRRPCAA
ncbi:hypothetical protein ACFVIJ_09870, partial [Heyndrickxia sporothermodurans]